jgi:hypothetical protein
LDDSETVFLIQEAQAMHFCRDPGVVQQRQGGVNLFLAWMIGGE